MLSLLATTAGLSHRGRCRRNRVRQARSHTLWKPEFAGLAGDSLLYSALLEKRRGWRLVCVSSSRLLGHVDVWRITRDVWESGYRNTQHYFHTHHRRSTMYETLR
jgi:hypothetical protein